MDLVVVGFTKKFLDFRNVKFTNYNDNENADREMVNYAISLIWSDKDIYKILIREG